jgi:hypothetical protein
MAMQSNDRVLTWLDLTDLSYAFLTFIRPSCAVGRVSASRYVGDQMEEGMRRINMCLICALLLTACEPTAQKVAESWQQREQRLTPSFRYLAEGVTSVPRARTL